MVNSALKGSYVKVYSETSPFSFLSSGTSRNFSKEHEEPYVTNFLLIFLVKDLDGLKRSFV